MKKRLTAKQKRAQQLEAYAPISAALAADDFAQAVTRAAQLFTFFTDRELWRVQIALAGLNVEEKKRLEGLGVNVDAFTEKARELLDFYFAPELVTA